MSRLGIKAQRRPYQIEQVYIAVTELEDGSVEALYSVLGRDGGKVPLVAVDDKSLKVLSKYAQDQVNKTGLTVSIIGFTRRTRHATFRPSTTGDKK